MDIPLLDLQELEGEKRSQAMGLLHQACEKWGCFKVENHGIDIKLMERVKHLVNSLYEDKLKQSFYDSEVAKRLVYEDKLKQSFYDSEVAKRLEDNCNSAHVDWESTFFIWHRPTSNINDLTHLSEDLRKTMDEYIPQVIKLAEKLSELISENLGLEKDYIKKAFSGDKGPSVGTKVAKYPQCPRPELVRGLREHTDAGGIILLLQDDQVPGLEFLKDGQWIPIPPSKNNAIFVNTGDQLEALSNGMYKSVVHRVMTDKNGSRLSIATFYNPAGEAIISPAPKLLYPTGYSFQDYLKVYASTKFSDKGPRFETMKKRVNGSAYLLA